MFYFFNSNIVEEKRETKNIENEYIINKKEQSLSSYSRMRY